MRNHLRFEGFVSARPLRVLRVQIFAPIQPLLHELAVVQFLFHHDMRESQQQRGFGARLRRQPPSGHARGIGKARINGEHLRPSHHAFDDALRVRVEIVPRLQVRRNEQDELRASVVWRGAVHAAPQGIAQARRCAAHIGVRVMPIDAPALQHAVHVAVVARAANVIHHFSAAAFLQRLANARRESADDLIPSGALVLPRATRPTAFQRIQNALGVINLIQRGWALGAIAPARRRVMRVAFQLTDAIGFFVDPRHQPARGFAVEASGGHEAVVLVHFARPRFRVVFHPIVPALHGWEGGKVAHLPRFARRRDVGVGHASGAGVIRCGAHEFGIS